MFKGQLNSWNGGIAAKLYNKIDLRKIFHLKIHKKH